ncbi:hypothetical protein CPB86DRAFT_876273 [Serendipita vermifera]|nr:hypothetical protein CPB86DRAFT_876273 [Serendipita vermifera]
MTERLHICVDCGGSKTAAAISTMIREPTVVARGYAGPSNYKDNGLRVFLAAIRSATQEALAIANGEPVELPTIDTILMNGEREEDQVKERSRAYLYSAWIGASGVDAIQDIRTLQPLLSRLLGVPSDAGRLVIANDAHIFSSPLLTVAESTTQAVVAIAGTGSVVISFDKVTTNTEGGQVIRQLARAGGWGYLLGDDGSGFFAGREAVREVLRQFNSSELEDPEDKKENVRSGKETLTSLLLAHFKLNSPDELFSVVYAPDSAPKVYVDEEGKIDGPEWARLNRKERFVSLCPLVFRAAFELRDPSALKALRTSVGGLATQIAGLCVKSGHDAQYSGETSRGRRVVASSAVLCLGGSLFKVADYRDLLLEELVAQGHTFEQVVYVDDACREGALGLAKLFG